MCSLVGELHEVARGVLVLAQLLLLLLPLPAG